MLKARVLFALIVIGLTYSPCAVGQNKNCNESELIKYRYVQTLKEQPKLGVEYDRVAIFKLAARKTKYNIGEMISIDLAMLNTFYEPVFLKRISPVAVMLTVTDEKGTKVGAWGYEVYQLGVSKELYTLLNPGEILVGSFQLFTDCEQHRKYMETRNQLLNNTNQLMGSSEDKLIFEKNLFINWGDACLNPAKPGKYTIIAEADNNHIIGSSCEPNTKTAVGTIRSMPLTITISE
jgi:hypothetical protein